MDSFRLVSFVVNQLVGQNNSILARTRQGQGSNEYGGWQIQHGSIPGFNTSQVFISREDALDAVTNHLLDRGAQAQGFRDTVSEASGMTQAQTREQPSQLNVDQARGGSRRAG